MDSARTAQACLALAILFFVQTSPAYSADKLSLKPKRQTGELTRVEIALQVGGDIKLANDGKEKLLPMSVVANLKYDEQLLSTSDAGQPSRSIRFYDDTRAVIKIDKGGEKPTLDPARRIVIAERADKSPAILYCPSDALRREELDLIDVPGNTLVIDQLLPTEPVSLGQTWKHSDETIAALLGLEAVSWTDVQSVLGEVKDGLADVAAAGNVSGAVGGVSTEIELKAKYKYDPKTHRISYLALLIKEKRAVGHVGPGLDTVAKLIVKIVPLPKSENLTAEVLKEVPKKLTPELAQLNYQSSGKQFRVPHDRRWFLTTDEPKLAVFRLVDRGELVAQCNISALPGDKDKPVTLAEFQKDVQDSLGKNFGQFVTAGQTTNDAGYTVYRVVVHGVVSELPIEWIYYLVSDGKGHKASLAFTLEESLQKRFDQADRTLVRELRLLESPTPTAAKPTQTK